MEGNEDVTELIQSQAGHMADEAHKPSDLI